MKLSQVIYETTEIEPKPMYRAQELDIDAEELVERLQRDCAVALKSAPIYRVIDGNKSMRAGFVDPKNSIRKSRWTTNYYTLLIDESPEWKQYPRRSRSIICAAGDWGASTRDGPRFVVFPVGNPEFGVCREVDLWFSFPYLEQEIGMHDLGYFGEMLENIAHYMGYELTDTKESLDGMLDDFEEKYRDETSAKTLEQTLKDNAYRREAMLVEVATDTYKGSMRNALYDLMSPSNNGFRLTTLSGLPANSDKEVWTEGSAYLIAIGYYQCIRANRPELGLPERG